MCRSPWRPEEGTGDLGVGVIDNCGDRELDVGLLMEHQMLLTSELSLQSLIYVVDNILFLPRKMTQ